MKEKFFLSLYFWGVFLGLVAGTSPPKIVYIVPEVAASELIDHSVLRLITPSGNIYHFKDDGILVRERDEDKENDSKKLPFITYGLPHGTKYYIHFPAEREDFQSLIGYDKSERESAGEELQLWTFAGPNRKRYSVAYFSYPFIEEILRVEDDIVNYLQLVFEYNSQVYAYTFTQSGDSIDKIENCTDSTFLTLNFPSGMVYKIKQYSLLKDEETTADISSLPYISFFHVDGAKYDIHFPLNSSGTPSIVRDTSRDRERCAGNSLSRFIGLDGKEYSFEVKDFRPTITLTSEEIKNKIKIYFSNPTGQSVRHEFSKEGEHLGLTMASGDRGVIEKPVRPFDVKNVELNCIQNCD